LKATPFREQLRQVLSRFPFDPRANAFTRCPRCNQTLTPVGREIVSRRVPPFVYAGVESFAECERCGRIYWRAAHLHRMMREIEALGL
jgi:uncharacterized protein with PIN domain